jgi:hypothetical protein
MVRRSAHRMRRRSLSAIAFTSPCSIYLKLARWRPPIGAAQHPCNMPPLDYKRDSTYDTRGHCLSDSSTPTLKLSCNTT